MRRKFFSGVYDFRGVEKSNTIAFQKLGKRVKELRKLNKLTQQTLAYDCEVDIRTIQRIEKGELNIGIDLLFTVATALGVDTKDLF